MLIDGGACIKSLDFVTESVMTVIGKGKCCYHSFINNTGHLIKCIKDVNFGYMFNPTSGNFEISLTTR